MDQREVTFRRARLMDIPAIVRLLIADPLGMLRESTTSVAARKYSAAFSAIDSDPNNELIVVTVRDEIVGTLQLTFIPSLTYQGGWRAQIEAVRISTEERARGIGRALLEWAIERAKERNCVLIQLTTHKSRPEARRFYESLGFTATHEGMKLRLPSDLPLS